jgi:FMN-dependent NADH-azoreductase
MKLLHVDPSILGQGSVSRILSAEIAATQKALHPGLEVSYRDLAAAPIGHLNGAHLAAAQGAVPADPAIEKGHRARRGDARRVPCRRHRRGRRAEGPQGLAGGKKVIVAFARGGFYGLGTPVAMWEHQEVLASAEDP